MVYLKHAINWIKFLYEKYIIRIDNPRYPVLLKLSHEVLSYITDISKNMNQSIDDIINQILKKVIDEIENK